jgi:DNA repair exonuclease SbcCD ATPase subunit
MSDEQTQQADDPSGEGWRRLAECEVLLGEAERSGEQVNAELQQLREQVTTLTRERDRYQSSLRDHYRDGQQKAAEALQTWLRPVLELVAEYPDDASPLAVAVLGFLPGIASRLIEE